MLPKILLVVSCLCALQASISAEEQSDGVTNLADVVLSRVRRSCGPYECNQHCKKLGHARGVCIGTYCQCRSRRRRSIDEEESKDSTNEVEKKVNDYFSEDPTEDAAEKLVENFADAIQSRSKRATCGYDECNRFCRKLGHARGVCIGNLCQCRFRRRRSVPQSDLENNKEEEIKVNKNSPLLNDKEKPVTSEVTNLADVVHYRSRRSCGAYDCNRHCRQLGHARGVCIGSYCQCRSR